MVAVVVATVSMVGTTVVISLMATKLKSTADMF